MDRPVELVPLVCLRCSTPIPAGIDEVAWVCSQCGQGLILDETNALQPLEVHYAAGIPQNTPGKPYWMAEGQVNALQRETYDSGRKGGQEAEQYWSQPRRFFVPAFARGLESTGKSQVFSQNDSGCGRSVMFKIGALSKRMFKKSRC